MILIYKIFAGKKARKNGMKILQIDEKYKNNRNVENFRSAIEEILTEFNQQIENIKINKYNVEIVFVPTFNDSMDLKNKMEE